MVTAVYRVSKDSKKLREEIQVPPPGDLGPCARPHAGAVVRAEAPECEHEVLTRVARRE